jgi:hypothetical protein
MNFLTICESLSFETEIEHFSSRRAAEEYVCKVLVDAGWPYDEAEKAAFSGEPILVADNGDDETISIRAA